MKEDNGPCELASGSRELPRLSRPLRRDLMVGMRQGTGGILGLEEINQPSSGASIPLPH